MQPIPCHTCPLCGGPNQCAPARAGTFDVACWCTAAVIPSDVLARVPADLKDRCCVCPRCARVGDEAGPESPGRS